MVPTLGPTNKSPKGQQNTEGFSVMTSRGFRRSLALLVFLLLPAGAQASAQHADSGSASELPQVSFEGLFYLTYQMGEDGGEDYSKFAVTRSYFTTRVKILPNLSARITMDGHQDSTGDMKVRLKYAYGKFDFGDWGGLTGVGLEAGIVHMVWLDFEEHIDLYRMRDKMFMERSGLFNSADFGLTLAGGFGEDLSDEFQDEVNQLLPRPSTEVGPSACTTAAGTMVTKRMRTSRFRAGSRSGLFPTCFRDSSSRGWPSSGKATGKASRTRRPT